ncbi:hypothetical protein FG379_001552 [Cryptosporidium bovis]|uniref:uncharacterized protein n=1 Tax=Cryptosporidium bovis TaxID=310047 RepID=UPI00351A51A5|nr:hypothetical protein FG379_001552 [Cryptosporidium bovis]
MFLLPSIGKKSVPTENDLEHVVKEETNKNNIRICSRCGDMFELDYENKDKDKDEYEHIIKSFSEYINLEKSNQYYFEDFLLQYIEVSIEKNNELKDSHDNIDDSLCLECIEYLIYGFKTLFKKNEKKLKKYSNLKKSCAKRGDENNSDLSFTYWLDNNNDIDLTMVIKDYISDNNIDIKEIVSDESINCNDNIIENDKMSIDDFDIETIINNDSEIDNEIQDYVDMKDVVKLRLYQNMELDLIQELRRVNSVREGVKVHFDNLKKYLDRLQKMDILNTCFYIDSIDGIGRINGLKLYINKNDFENWNEINACFGLISLLLNMILEKYDLDTCIKPRGSYSTIYDSTTKKTWPLYGSKLCNSDYSECISFDNAVSCIFRLINTTFDEIIRKKTSVSKNNYNNHNSNSSDSNNDNGHCSYKLPFKYDQKENKIENLSINLLFNDKHNWNKAMKMMLFNLKWLLVVSCEN